MRTAAQLQSDGWDALVERLGIADALRYRALDETGTGDYARERARLFANVGLDEWLELMRSAETPRNQAR